MADPEIGGCLFRCDHIESKQSYDDECQHPRGQRRIGNLGTIGEVDGTDSSSGTPRGEGYNQSRSCPQWRSELIQLCEKERCQTVSQVRTILANLPDDRSLIAFRKRFAQECADVLLQNKCRLLSWDWVKILNYIAKDPFTDCLPVCESVCWIRKIFAHNGFDELTFCSQIMSLINKTEMKINTVIFHGAPNSGKTLLGLSIARSCLFYAAVQDFNKNNDFYLQDVLHQRFCFINEPAIADERFETFKNVLEGATVTINAKYQSNITLDRTPCLICTNNPIAFFTRDAYRNENAVRARSFKFVFQPMSDLKNCIAQLHPLSWLSLLENNALL